MPCTVINQYLDESVPAFIQVGTGTSNVNFTPVFE